MRRNGRQILVVDDEENIALLIKMRLSYIPDSEIHTVTSAHAALAMLQHQAVDLLITDFSMPDMNGLDLVAKAKKAQPDLPVLMVTGVTKPELRRQAATARIQRVFTKPIPFRQFCEQVEAILQREGTF